jgi:hypothetical protein
VIFVTLSGSAECSTNFVCTYKVKIQQADAEGNLSGRRRKFAVGRSDVDDRTSMIHELF